MFLKQDSADVRSILSLVTGDEAFSKEFGALVLPSEKLGFAPTIGKTITLRPISIHRPVP